MAELSVTEYVAARATPTLVDRLPALETIKRAIDDRSRSYVIYISGDGGTGKTFLTHQILDRCKPGGEWYQPDSIIAAEKVVDFYHTETHSLEGFTRAVWQALGPARGEMVRYEHKLAEFDRKKRDLAEMLRELSNSRQEVARAFMADLNTLAEENRLILALDTAERLLYDTDEIQKVLDLVESGDHGIAVLPWLQEEFLPGLRNAVVLVAARPAAERLKDDLRRAVGDRFEEVKLGGFATKEDASAYFDAVSHAARQAGKEESAGRIDAIPPDTREVIWLYTGGRPILLSLMVDYLVVASELLPAVKVPVEQARAHAPDELRDIAAQLEAELVRLFQNQGRPADEAIRLLGWARRGLDAKLLAHVADMEPPEAEALLAELADLSFVKMRREDGRAFAHDIFGEMLERHVLATLPQKSRDRTYKAILEHYEAEIKEARAEVERLTAELAEQAGRDPDLLKREKVRPEIAEQPLEKALHRLYRLLPEEVFYRLRLNAADGFRAYHIYKKEASWANLETLDMELRSELLQFAAEHKGVKRFDGVSRNDLELDSGLGWIERNIRRAQYKRALQVARDLEVKCQNLFEEGDPLDRAQLAAFKALALTYTGDDLDRAEALLTETVRVYERFEHENPFQTWRRDTALADAFNTLGFLYRTQGLYRKAIAAYRRALPLWRSLADREKVPTMHRAIEAQHANTLNNLSWALAWVGQFRQAEFACQDALAMRRRLGPLGPLAFSLNTLGLIQIKNDQPHRGGVNCAQALDIFRYLEQPRGAGLARIALAEALRRRATIPDLYTWENRTSFLRDSEEHAREAVRIFTEELQEPPQLIQARIEQGCTYRDLAAVQRQVRGPAEESQNLAKQGEQALRQAIKAGKEEASLQHMVLDARVNLAWLYAENGETDQARLELKEALDSVPPEYRIEPGSGLPETSLPQSFLWVQLGKAYLLFGKMAIDRFKTCDVSECRGHLEKAAEHYSLALAYYGLFADDFRDMRQGMRRIYDSLKGLDLRSEFPSFFDGTSQAAKSYALETPTALQQFLVESFGLA